MTPNLILQAIILATGIGGQLLLVKRKISAFYVWTVSNLALITLSLLNRQYAISLLYGFYTVMCAVSIVTWRKLDRVNVR